jgi:ribosomal subunit interface protein
VGKGGAMELILKGRGVRVTEQIRRTAERKLAKIERFEPRVVRLKVELIEERNPRIPGTRVEVACETARQTFRAEGEGPDVDSALDQVIQRLERQISGHRGKLRDRWTRRGNRLQSPRTSHQEAGTSE